MGEPPAAAGAEGCERPENDGGREAGAVEARRAPKFYTVEAIRAAKRTEEVVR